MQKTSVPQLTSRGTPLSRLASLALLAWAGMAAAQPNPQLPPELTPYFSAIKSVESKGYPWSIYNNTISKSYKLNTRQEAEAKASELLALGHNLDLGLMQLNWKYQGKRPGVTMANVFDPQTNEGVARQVFLEFWQQAQKLAGDFNRRIMAAVGAYNNGRINLPNPSYLKKVWGALGKATTEILQDVTGNGGPQVAPSSGGASKMDESLGRTSGKKNKRLTPEEANSESQAEKDQAAQDESSNSSGWLALFFGVSLLAIGALCTVLLIKAVGLYKAFRIAKFAASATKARAKNL